MFQLIRNVSYILGILFPPPVRPTIKTGVPEQPKLRQSILQGTNSPPLPLRGVHKAPTHFPVREALEGTEEVGVVHKTV